MKLLRYERCTILSFPSIGKWKLELVFAPAGYRIREHTHPNQNIKLIPLYCRDVTFCRRKWDNLFGESYRAGLKDIGRTFTIEAGDAHYFEVSKHCLLFLNIEHWLTSTPTSAAIDLQLTTATNNT